MYYGWRGKIGLISPATSPSIENDFNRFAPEGVATLTTRILLESVDEKGLGAMEGAGDREAGSDCFWLYIRKPYKRAWV